MVMIFHVLTMVSQNLELILDIHTRSLVHVDSHILHARKTDIILPRGLFYVESGHLPSP